MPDRWIEGQLAREQLQRRGGEKAGWLFCFFHTLTSFCGMAYSHPEYKVRELDICDIVMPPPFGRPLNPSFTLLPPMMLGMFCHLGLRMKMIMAMKMRMMMIRQLPQFVIGKSKKKKAREGGRGEEGDEKVLVYLSNLPVPIYLPLCT